MSTYYDTIKQAATDAGIRVNDLLALAPANDPFYTGRPSEIEAATWFANLWKEFGYSRGIHLRRIHYQIVSQSPRIEMPNGNGAYENTQRCWDYLNNAAKWARYLDMVSAEAFVDRRNPDAIVNANFPVPGDWSYEDPTPSVSVTELDDWAWDSYAVPALPDLPELPDRLPTVPGWQVGGYDSIQQPYLIEIWAEKTTMNDVLEPLCQRYGVNLVTGAGELSITAVLQFMERVQRANRPARILYVSDFDPAGLGMPISVARKIEFYLRKGDYHADIRLQPVVLTAEQVEEYDLPRVPVKDSDKRKTNFEAAHGTGQVELDALEALHPGELSGIVEQTILSYYDTDLSWSARNVRHALMDDLVVLQADVTEPYREDVDTLTTGLSEIRTDYEETRALFREMVAQFQDKLDAYQDRISTLRETGQTLYRDIYLALSETDIDLDEYPLPEPDLYDDPDDLLYDSRRTYGEQLAYYKAYRNGEGEDA